VSKITDPGVQTRAVGEIAGSMARNNNVAGGQEFIAQSPLTPEAKAQMTQMITPNQRGGRGNGGGGNFGGAAPGGGGGGRGGRGGR
jgi:hypothetical protein